MILLAFLLTMLILSGVYITVNYRRETKKEKELLAELNKLRVLFYWNRYAVQPYQVTTDGENLHWLDNKEPLNPRERALFSELVKQKALSVKQRNALNKLITEYQHVYKQLHKSQPFIDFSFEEFERPRLTLRAK